MGKYTEKFHDNQGLSHEEVPEYIFEPDDYLEEVRKELETETGLDDSPQQEAKSTNDPGGIHAKRRNKFYCDPFYEPEIPPVTMTVDGIITCTQANLSLILGAKKTKKSFFVSMGIAAALSGEKYCNLEITLPEGKDEVYHFDTEQSPYHVSIGNKRVMDILKHVEYEISYKELTRRFRPFAMRAADSVKVRADFIIKEIQDNSDNVGIVFIDGIRDLLDDINDPKSSSVIVSRLMALSVEANVHILLVLHTNKGDNNARGHLGTELSNKCETVFRVRMLADNSQYTIVEADATRNLPFDAFTFFINPDGIPILGDVDIDLINKSSNRKPEPDEIDKERYLDLVCDWNNLTTSQALEEIAKYFDDFEPGNIKQGKILKYIVNNGIVEKKRIAGQNAYLYSRII